MCRGKWKNAVSPEKHVWGEQENAESLGHPLEDACPSLAVESGQDFRRGDQNSEMMPTVSVRQETCCPPSPPWAFPSPGYSEVLQLSSVATSEAWTHLSPQRCIEACVAWAPWQSRHLSSFEVGAGQPHFWKAWMEAG